MQVNVGDIVEGKVTGLTNFGAFVKLSTGEGGMVHISEVASSYVKDSKEFLSEGQSVKVKIPAVSDAGKISLSIKQAEPKPAEPKEETAPAAEEKPAKKAANKTTAKTAANKTAAKTAEKKPSGKKPAKKAAESAEA